MEIREKRVAHTADQVADGKWVAEVSVASFMKAHPEDKRTPRSERPLIVPVRHWARVLGVEVHEIKKRLVSQHRTTPDQYGYVSIEQTWILVSDKPFVVVHFRDDNEWRLHRRVTAARQMHKGELGRKPELPFEIEWSQSSIPSPDGYWDNTNSEEPQYVTHLLSWVELRELSDITCLTTEEIIRGFAGFSSSNYYEPNVPLLRGNPEQEELIRVYVGEVPTSFCGGEFQWGGKNAISLSSLQHQLDRRDVRLRVLRSFAHTVIRLMQFGYRPENEAPEHSFRLEAPMPIPQMKTLPVLPADELRMLHELRAHLSQELPEEAFRRAAQEALGTDQWCASPELDDTSQGFSYYVNFERLEAFDGQLVISTCFWTRGGSPKSNNYYAGFLAVFPKGRIADPRRDQSAVLRIWFWPNELVRAIPSGSRDGLCPSWVRPEIAERVRLFLTSLGYSI